MRRCNGFVLFVVVLAGAILGGCVTLEDRLLSQDEDVRALAERELVQSVSESGTVEDQIAAVRRLSDQKLLVEIARGQTAMNFEGRVAIVAVGKISDVDDLYAVAIGGRDRKTKLAALDRITGQSDILCVAEGASDAYVKLAAIRRLSDKGSAVNAVFGQTLNNDLIAQYLQMVDDAEVVGKIVDEYESQLTDAHMEIIKAKGLLQQDKINEIGDERNVREFVKFIKTHKNKYSWDEERTFALFSKIRSAKDRDSLYPKFCRMVQNPERFLNLVSDTGIVACVETLLKIRPHGKAVSEARDFVAKIPAGRALGVLKASSCSDKECATIVRDEVVKNQENIVALMEYIPAERGEGYAFLSPMINKIDSPEVADAFVDKYLDSLNIENLVAIMPKISDSKRQQLVSQALLRTDAQAGALKIGGFCIGMHLSDYVVLAMHYNMEMRHPKDYGINSGCWRVSTKDNRVVQLSFANRDKFKFIDCEDTNVLNQIIHQCVEMKKGSAYQGQYASRTNIETESGIVWRTYSCTRLSTKVWFQEKTGELKLTAL